MSIEGDEPLWAEQFTARADQSAGCGHTVPVGGITVTLRRYSPFGPVLANLCGECFSEIGHRALDEGDQ